jgi:hypothetical protein
MIHQNTFVLRDHQRERGEFKTVAEAFAALRSTCQIWVKSRFTDDASAERVSYYGPVLRP